MKSVHAHGQPQNSGPPFFADDATDHNREILRLAGFCAAGSQF